MDARVGDWAYLCHYDRSPCSHASPTSQHECGKVEDGTGRQAETIESRLSARVEDQGWGHSHHQNVRQVKQASFNSNMGVGK